jgi:hypothetical protein
MTVVYSLPVATDTAAATKADPVYTSPKARAYDAHAPETGVPEAQAEERHERRVFREETRQHRRTGRNRGIVVPDLPWKRGGQSS